ncbi:hypothetical protein L1049_004990 [Liquidambar formosana]|uniref:glutathione transferase n=1 Tax=Liquidambar formosana TaxID=63359 RepID=A0AAP0RPW6_LIQFO
MAIKLYGLPMSTCTNRVIICLHEKEVGFEFVPVNLFGGEHKQPTFTAKNEDGDLTLFESRAITAYVAEKFKDTGSDLIRYGNPNEAALVKVWSEVESQQFNPAISPIVYQFFVAPLYGSSADQAVIDANVEKLGKVLDVYEAKLSSTKYLAGDFYSLADLHHLPYTHYFMKTPWASLINSRPHVKAWWEDISSRPAYKKVSEAMTFVSNQLYLTHTLSLYMAIKLYGLPRSTATCCVLTCLHEKEVEFEFVPVNLSAGEHKQPSFTTKNPFGQIPVLEDGDVALFESRAITAYVAEKFEGTGYDLLRHGNLNEAALVKVWIEVESQQFNPPISQIIHQFFLAPLYGKSTDQAVIDANVEKLGKVLDVYEAKLSCTKYLAGDFYSLADLHHLPHTHYFMKTPWASIINGRPHVKAWWEDISSRPSFKKVAEAMTAG